MQKPTSSLRDVESILAAHGVVVSYESIRDWGLRFSRLFSNALQRRRPRPGDKAPPATKPTKVPPSAPASSSAASPATPSQNMSAAGQTQVPVDVEAILPNVASQKVVPTTGRRRSSTC